MRMIEIRLWKLAALLSVTITIGASAQNTNSGDLRGVVTDQTGAIIPGVTVVVKDTDKDITRTLTTDDSGLYDTGPIVPDHYLITFTKEGFVSLIRGPITVGVGINTVGAELGVGSASQQITVTSDLPLLQTESGAVENTLEATTIAELPQANGADWQNFIILQPGTSGTPQNSSSALNPQQGASVNGNLPFQSVLLDGASTTLPRSQNADVTIFETTAEVKTSSVAFSAQYGVGGIVYNQITKGGTDKFHGAAYEYFQNDALNAAPYGFGVKQTVPFQRFNNFGFAVGGPVKPLKNVFAYFAFDKIINRTAGSGGFETVPDSRVLAGDFSADGLPTLFDPTSQIIKTTGICDQAGTLVTASATSPCVQRTAFQDEPQYGGDGTHATNKIPQELISPTSLNIQKYYPRANAAGTPNGGYNVNNFHYSVPSNNPFTKFFGRLDYDVTASNRLTASVTTGDNPIQNLQQGICPVTCYNGDVDRTNAEISDVWTISPSFINEARMGFTDQLNFFSPFGAGTDLSSQLGMPMLVTETFPSINISNYFGLSNPFSFTAKEMVYDPSDAVTLIKGSHVLHFGGEFLISQDNATAFANRNSASLNFTGTYTSSGGQNTLASTGFGYADFLMGQTDSWNANISPEYGGRWKVPQVFVQDDWKARPNLTIDLGLRYEAMKGIRDVNGNEKAFDPAVVSKDVTDAVGSGYGETVQGGMWYAFLGQNGRTTLQAPAYDIILPRVGFSWQLHNNMVVRGGIGIYSSVWSEDTYGAGLGAAYGSLGNDSDATNGLCPVVQIGADGTQPDTTDPGCGVGSLNGISILSTYLTAPTTPWAGQGPNQSATYNAYHTPVPKNYQWTLGVQEQLGRDYVGELTYVGNHGTGLSFPVDINQVPEGALQFGPNDQQYRPYPLYGSITGSTNNAISNYNALEAVATKRMSSGLQFSANYTFSHLLDDQDSAGWAGHGGYQYYQNAYAPKENYSQSNFDIRQMLKGEVIYKLPFGSNARFARSSNRVVDAFIGGWQLSSIFIAQDGNPLTVTTGGLNNSNNRSGSGTQYANLTGNYKSADSVTGNRYHSVAEWYNVDAFSLPAQGAYGTFRRNVIVGPGLTNINSSLGKSFSIWPDRGVSFQLRADASNILNHPSWAPPGGGNAVVGCTEATISSCPATINSTTIGGRSLQLYGRLYF